MRRKRKRNEEG